MILIDGKILPREEAKISVEDRAFLFGDGIFTTLKLQDGKLFFTQQHLERLQVHAREIGIVPPEIPQHWMSDLATSCKANKGNWRLKIIITGGKAPHRNLSERSHGHVVMMLEPFSYRSQKEALTLCTVKIDRPTGSYKSLSYLDRLWMKHHAELQGFDDSLALSAKGYVMETAFANIFWREGETIYTPDTTDLPLVKGIALTQLMHALKQKGLAVKEVKMTVQEIEPQAQVFSINCIQDIVPIKKISTQPFARNADFEHFLTETFKTASMQHEWDLKIPSSIFI